MPAAMHDAHRSREAVGQPFVQPSRIVSQITHRSLFEKTLSDFWTFGQFRHESQGRLARADGKRHGQAHFCVSRVPRRAWLLRFGFCSKRACLILLSPDHETKPFSERVVDVLFVASSTKTN